MKPSAVLTGLACALAAAAQAGAAPLQQPVAQASQAAGPAAREGEYVIGAGDVLQLSVWKETELTREVTVRFDGRITVPLLGDLDTTGKTPQQLAAEIATKLARYLASPQVTVGVSQANSARFYVMGQVAKPGEYTLSGQLTVLQALALSGGLKEFAKPEQIVILRTLRGSQVFLPFNYKRVEGGRDNSQNVVIRPGDTIIVP